MRIRVVAPLVAALSSLALYACGQQSPAQRAWPTYSKAATNILAEYDTAMNGVATVDLGLIAPNPPPKGGIQPLNNDQAVQEFEKTVIPLLDKAAAEANGIEFKTDSPLARLHQNLVQGLALKADAYKSLISGYRGKNIDVFEQGVTKLSQGDVLMGNFRACFQQGVMDGAPPNCSTQVAAPVAKDTPAGDATPANIPGIPGIPGMTH